MEPAAVSDDGGRVVVREEGGEVGVLEIRNVSLSDAGSYTCVAAHPLVEPVLTSALLEVEGENYQTMSCSVQENIQVGRSR